MQKKKLHGIKPFSDCWFRTCYYHQLIAGLSYFGVPSEYSLMNYKAEVSDFVSWKDFSFEEKSVLSDCEFDELTGIERKKYHVDDIADTIEQCVNRKHPVIVGQDNFYLPHRTVYYNKQHWAHFVLCYGYDKTDDTIIINEHEFISSYDFCERKVSLKDLVQAYAGFKNYYTEYDWSVTELCPLPIKSPFAKSAEHIEKTCVAMRSSNFKSLIKPYLSLNALQIEDINKVVEYCVFLTKHVRLTMKLYELFANNKEISSELETLWQHCKFVQGVAVKVQCVNDTKFLLTDITQRRIQEMQRLAEKLDKEIAAI